MSRFPSTTSDSASSARPAPVDLAKQSVAGEEDPGASMDMPGSSPAQPGGSPTNQPFGQSATLNPGDEAPPGTPGTAENICRDCGGSGRLASGICNTCGGTGKVNVGLGGA